MRSLFVLAFLAALAIPGISDTIYVPDDHSTIQDAIAASANGDRIIVRPGTYTENIDFLGKAITVESEWGPHVTTIDGSQAGSVVTFDNAGSGPAVLRGFTITNGTCGIYCFVSSPSIIGNVIWDNAPGRGIECFIYSSPIVQQNSITENDGGGISCFYLCDPSIVGNVISRNSAETEGGGIYAYDLSSPQIIGNTITENTAGDRGGGLHFSNDSGGNITGNLIADNWAPRGGAIYIDWKSGPCVYSSTITGNHANIAGGGIHHDSSGMAWVHDTIFWNNTAPTGPEVYVGAWSTLTIAYSDVDGGLSSVFTDPNAILNWGSGMIDADPLFVDAVGGDYHLQQDPPQAGVVNPCVDAGDPTSSLIAGWTRTDCVPDAGLLDLGYHYTVCSPVASATFRNAGSNPTSHAASTLPVLGSTYTATVDVGGTSGHSFAWLVGFSTPTTTLLNGGQTLLVNVADPHGELLQRTTLPGPLATFDIPVPADLALTGFNAATQALHTGGVAPFALSNAQDLVLGY